MSPSATIGRAAALVSAGILLSRILGYLRTVVIGAQLGVNVESDLYTAAFLIPDYLFFLMAGGYLSITLVPLLVRHLAAGDEAAARASFTSVFRLVVGLMVIATVAALIAARPITATVFPRFDGSELTRLVGMVRIAFVSQLFFVGGTLLMAAQYASKRFLVPTLAPIVYNLGIIAGGLLGGLLGEPSPEGFMWGGLAGAVTGNFAIQWWGAHRAGIRLVGGVPIRHPAVAEYLTLAFPLMIGQSVVGLDEAWPRIFGQFAGEGAQAGLAFARQLNMLPVGVIAQAAGVAAFPFLAGLAAEGRMDELRAGVARSVRAAMSIGGLAAALVAALSYPIVRVAFQYGRFDADDTAFVAPLLLFYSFSIPFWAAHQVYTRGLYSLRRMWTPVIIGSVVTAALVPVLWWLVQAHGARGVAAGSTAGIAAYTLAVAAAWHLSVSRSDGPAMAVFGAKVALTGLAAGGAAALVAGLLEPHRWPTAALLVAAAAAGTLVYLGGGRLLGLAEVGSAVKAARSRLRRDVRDRNR